MMHPRLRLLTLTLTLSLSLSVTAVGLSACGSTADGPSAVAHSDDADTGVVRVGRPTQIPDLVIGGDRWVYTRAAIDETDSSAAGFASAPQVAPAAPVATPMVRRRLTARGLDVVLDRADELGLLADPAEYADPQVTDMGSTYVSFTVDSGSYEHDAYALGFDEETGNRARLLTFRNEVVDLEALVGADEIGPVEAWEPDRYVVGTGGGFDLDDVDSDRVWPDGIDVIEGCVALPIDRFPADVAGIYVATIDGRPTGVQVVPDLPGDSCH